MMLKRLSLIAALLAATVTHAFAYGTIQLSLSQQFDATGVPLSGGLLYFYQAGTTTPQNAYSDTALTLALPNPLTLDASGRIPQFFLADGNIKIRLTDRNGVTVIAADNLLVIGPSSGGGGGGSTIDPTTIFSTGDMKAAYGTSVLSGWVRANGRTIGSATSGASERANADCINLFEYLWQADSTLTVSGGRGASAAADWAANKTIALPDWRGRAVLGLDAMGNSAAGILTVGNYGADGTVLGTAGGGSMTISQANLPNITNLPVTIPAGQGSHAHSIGISSQVVSISSGGSFPQFYANGGGITTTTNTLPSMTGTASLGGSGTPLVPITPGRTATIYLKL